MRGYQLENQTKLDKLNIRHREMIQELKDKEFQLECIQQLLTNSICNESVLDWCEDHGQYVGIRVRKFIETDL